VSLLEQLSDHRGRPFQKWGNYFDAYERHFSQFRNQPCTMIEIGCGRGGSLQMWKRWLGPQSRIIGIDIKPDCKQYEEDRVSVYIGKQANKKLLRQIVSDHGPPDIVLDDGSHFMADMRASFDALYYQMSPTGVYAVEDLHACYRDRYGGGYKTEASFIEFCKDKLDELNAARSQGAVTRTTFSKSTKAMTMYESIVFFERAPYARSESLLIGEQQEELPK
jgi:hypothetical protein